MCDEKCCKNCVFYDDESEYYGNFCTNRRLRELIECELDVISQFRPPYDFYCKYFKEKTN
jgi:hypothetical protein